jgi:Skp family chaperone for outer membrane proteins
VSAVEPAGHIGTIDTAKLAADLRWDTEMNANVTKMTKQMDDEFQQLAGIYSSLLQQKAKEMGFLGTETKEESAKKFAALTQDQQRELTVMSNEARQKLTQVQQYANQQLEKYRNDCLTQYSVAIRPIVRRISEQKKLSIVINIQQIPLMYSDPMVDITNAVVDAANANPPKLYPVDPPKMISDLFAKGPSTQPTTVPATKTTTPVTPVKGK